MMTPDDGNQTDMYEGETMDRNNRDMNMNLTDIQHGWDVMDVNGDKVGDVKEVNPGYLTISKGFFFPSERYIPLQDVRATRDDRVLLNVSKDELKQEGWDQPPLTTDRTTTTTGRTTMRRGTERLAERPLDETERGEREINLREERLVPREERVRAGEVDLNTDVVQREQTVDVPVRSEEVIVERQPVKGRPANQPIGQEQDISVPVYKDKVDLDKESVVYEQVNVETRPVEETRRVKGQVKKEVLDTSTKGDVNVIKRGKGSPPPTEELRETDDTEVPPTS